MAELQARMSAAEFLDWRDFYDLHPWGEDRADLRMGILASSLINAMTRLWSRRPSHARPSDFMPFKPPRRQSFEDMRAVLNRAAQWSAGRQAPGAANA